LLALGFCSFFCLGLVLVLPGANQAGLARDLGLDLSSTGLLAAALAVGMGIGVVGAGPLFDRYARRPLFIAATSVAGLALFGFRVDTSLPEAVALVALTGIGVGAYDTLFNATVVEMFLERSVKPMSILHSAATLGAMLGPTAVALVIPPGHWTWSFWAVGAIHLLLAFSALFVHFPPPNARPRHHESHESVLSFALLPFALVAFGYVGVEAAMTMFAVPYATGGLALDASRGQGAISAFWFGLLVGRLAPLLRPNSSNARLLIAAGSLGAFAILLGTGMHFGEIELLFATVGFGLGCVYPVMIALVAQRFPNARGAATGVAAGVGAFGGFAIPWLTGGIGDAIGIEFAIATLTVWCVAIAIGGALALRGSRSSPP
jgi:MFS family permease